MLPFLLSRTHSLSSTLVQRDLLSIRHTTLDYADFTPFIPLSCPLLSSPLLSTSLKNLLPPFSVTKIQHTCVRSVFAQSDRPTDRAFLWLSPAEKKFLLPAQQLDKPRIYLVYVAC